jgi:undecaprenyl pyrophosphate phosphatase UppP
VFDATKRDDPDYRMGWNVIIGSMPIAFVGLALQDAIEGPFRSLWVVVAGPSGGARSCGGRTLRGTPRPG